MQETILTPSVEKDFKKWFKKIANETGINDNPDDPLHHYDYRAAFLAGVKPDPEQGHHWPSEYKRYTHEDIIPKRMGPNDKDWVEIHSPTGQKLKDLLPTQAWTYGPTSEGSGWEREYLKGLNPHLDPLNTKMDEETGLNLNPYLRKENLSKLLRMSN